MFKLLLITIVLVPVLLGMYAGSVRSTRSRGLLLMLALVLGYDLLYVAMLYYVRVRWVGWGSG